MVNIYEMSYKEYNLQQKYNLFNRLYFNNELPQIKLSFRKLKNASGLAKAKFITISDAGKQYITDETKRLYYVNGNRLILKDSVSITISSTYDRNEQTFDGILIHEMIHVYAYIYSYEKDPHGEIFINKVKEISQKAGFEIPIVDTIEDKEIANSKEFLIVELKTNNGISFSFLNSTFAKDLSKMEHLLGFFNYYYKNTTAKISELTIYYVKSKKITEIVYRTGVPISRSTKTLKFYRLNSQIQDEFIAELHTNGTVTYSINENE